MLSGKLKSFKAFVRTSYSFAKSGQELGVRCGVSLTQKMPPPRFALLPRGSLRAPRRRRAKLPPPASRSKARGRALAFFANPDELGRHVGRGDSRTTPLRQVHAVRQRRGQVLPPGACLVLLCGLTPCHRRPGSVSILALLQRRIGTGLTTWAVLSHPRATATHASLESAQVAGPNSAHSPPASKPVPRRWWLIPSREFCSRRPHSLWHTPASPGSS